MPELFIKWDELIAAFSGDIPEFDVEWHLDIESGRTICINDFDDEETRTRERELLEAEPGRYARLEPLSADEIFDVMTLYSMSIAEKNLKELIWLALDSKSPALMFAETLKEFPVDWENWKYYLRRETVKKILKWLKSIGVEPANAPPE